MYSDLTESEEGLFQLVVCEVKNLYPRAYETGLISKHLHECPQDHKCNSSCFSLINQIEGTGLHYLQGLTLSQNEELYDLMIKEIDTMKTTVYFFWKIIDEEEGGYEFERIQGAF
uniref:Phage protein n=1 Tax=Rhabditophanes sp. KR3021 TaxID=114890 RepID=A0AC35UI51_9BILA